MGSAFPILDYLPVGFRFRPTDEELIDHYLKHKLLGNDSMVNDVIAEIDVCKYEPWNLLEFSRIKSDDPEWFFLCPRDYKYAKSKRFNRATKCGYWKATGNDRNIKRSGTSNIIGSKKTLVFYEGRLPGVKTNWVIHEYHAVTFDESQRTYVLCRLMKKTEKKTEVGTDTLIYDEGEPSRHIGSEYENEATLEGISYISGTLPEMNIESMFKGNHEGDNYFPSSTQHSPIGIEQEASFPNSPSANAYFGSNMDTPFDTTEQEDEFINSMFISEDFVINENRGHAFVNGPIQSESLRRVYHESSDEVRYQSSETDAEVHHEHPRSSASKLFKLSYGDVSESTCLQSSNSDANRNKKKSTFQDELWGVETSSCDSTANKPLEINSIEISNSAISQRSAVRSQTQKKVSSNAVSRSDIEAEKKLHLVRSEKTQNKAQNENSRENLETRRQHSSIRKCSFICMETTSSSKSLSPRSVYLVNVVIGILLLIAISWDVLSC